MKKNILLIIIVATTFLTSCAVYKSKTSKTIDIYGAGVINKPVLVDLDVKEKKATGIANAKKRLPLEIIKQNAIANALKNENADVLVEPIFETEIYRRNITVTVTGWPATYKNFRSIQAEDVPLIQVGVSQKTEVYESLKKQPKRRGK